jgi:hypothetical protein
LQHVEARKHIALRIGISSTALLCYAPPPTPEALWGGQPQIRNTGDDQVSDWVPSSPLSCHCQPHQAEIMMRIASEFGFTPASRSCKQFITSRPVLGGLHHHYCRI